MQKIIENFLKQLENIFMEYDNRIEKLRKELEEIKYITGLIEVLKASKSGFAESLFQLKPYEEQKFISTIKKIIPNNQLTKQIKESYNLYNLKKEGLLNKKEVQPQQKEAEDAIKSIQDSLEEYIKNYDLVRINKEISETQKHIENILTLGGKFEDGKITSPIENIDFLANIVERLDLKEGDKTELLKYCLIQNLSAYKNENVEIEKLDFEILEENEIIPSKEAKETLAELLNNDKSPDMKPEEQTTIIESAKMLIDKNKKQIEKLTYADKELINNYIKELYQERENRISMYKSKNKGDLSAEVEAAYELQYFVNLINDLDKRKREDRILISKTCQRLKEILESFETYEKDTQKDFIINTESPNKRNIYFLMKNEKKSVLEEDMDSNEYNISIIIELIKQLQTEEIDENEENISNTEINILSKNDTGILYIPVSEEDIIIVGINDFKDKSQKEEEIKKYQKKIENLKKRIKDRNKKSIEISKTKKIIKKIESQNKNNELNEDELLKEIFDNTQEETETNDKVRRM